MSKKQKQKNIPAKPLYVKVIAVLLILAFAATFIISAIAGING